MPAATRFSTISPSPIRRRCNAFYDAGCRYLQFDDTAWAYLCSQEELKKARERGLDVDHLQETYTACINKALEAKPADMTITTHVCRGNFRSTFISSGGYEPVAESLLAKCNYDGYFLEYDTDRAGGFEPLRFLPKGNKIVVLGLVTSKIRPAGATRRHQEAHRGSDQISSRSISWRLSPQCGFASTEEGNVLAEDEQWAKLRMIVDSPKRCGAAELCADASWPPFRADHVGSLLRPAPLKEARAERERGEITAGAAQGGRGPRDRNDHQTAGGHRAQGRDRRRVPPRLLELRFSGRARSASKPISASARSSSRASTPSR